jgi:hypothetical protein
MKIRDNLFFLLCSLIVSMAAFAQTVTIDAEYRPRAEIRQGFKKPLADTLDYNAVVLQRTRLNADYKSNSLNAHLTLQDARIWGQSDTKSSSPQLSVYEAWVEMLLSSGLSLEAGRQSLKYDDQRLLAASNWSNTGNAHDALLLKYRDSFIQAHAGFAYNNTNDTTFTYRYNVSGMYQSMGFVWLSKEIVAGLNLSVIGIGEGLPRSMVTSGNLKIKTKADSNSTVTFGRFTYGGNLVYQDADSRFGGTLTGYIQSGKDAKMGTLSAYLFAAKGTAKILDELSVAAGVDCYSGTSNTDTAGIGTTKSYTFNKLYGSNHSFNGSMEYWSSLPSGGLIDYYAGATYKLSKDLSIDLTGHLFSLAEIMYTPSKVGTKFVLLDQKDLGSELDVTINYQWSKEVAIQGGYSSYFTTSTTTLYSSITTSISSPQWTYVMLTVKPTFFKSAN